MFNGMKERAVEKGINMLIADYGTVQLHDCDFKKKALSGSLELIGEDEAIEFKCKYKLIQVEDEAYIRLSSINISKEWMQKLADDYVKGVDYEIDSRLSFLIEAL